MTDEQLNASAQSSAVMVMRNAMEERLEAKGHFVAECYGPGGELKWRDEFHNTAMTVGKNVILDQALAGSA